MSWGWSRDYVLLFMGVVGSLGCMAVLAGAPAQAAISLVAQVLAYGALWQIGRIDGERFRIDPGWLLLLLGAGGLWQMQTVGPDAVEGLLRSMTGAGVGFLVGGVPLLVAQALGRRWPFFPGDVLLFAALGWLLGPWGLVWSLPVGSACALGRHAFVQRLRGRSWLQGYVPLGPGMAIGGSLVLWAVALERAGHGLG